MKTIQMRISRGYLFRSCYKKEGSQHHLYLAETQRQAGKWDSFTVKSRESIRTDVIGACLRGETGSQLIRTVFYVLGSGSISSWEGAKYEEASGHYQVLTIPR